MEAIIYRAKEGALGLSDFVRDELQKQDTVLDKVVSHIDMQRMQIVSKIDHQIAS